MIACNGLQCIMQLHLKLLSMVDRVIAMIRDRRKTSVELKMVVVCSDIRQHYKCYEAPRCDIYC